ncbi:MAG: amidohydrolase family protein [Deltaproteobacteria bacterium]|nr:amidohydrolase family protein [Deltaproteobacteria bacterium]
MIHRAPWVVADVAAEIYGDCRGIIEDGAVVVSEGLIRDVGKSKDIFREFGTLPVREHESGALVPALVNSHCHLELSYLDLTEAENNQDVYANDFTLWIRDLLKARDKYLPDNTHGETQIQTLAHRVLQEMSAEGIGFVGDMGNSLESRTIGKGHGTEVRFLLELLGLTREAEAQALARLEKVFSDDSLDVSCTAHAPYSTTATAIRKIKDTAELQAGIFSIHTAESLQEVEFLQAGKGCFLDFLNERGAWDNTFKVPGMGPVHYLDSLGVLNDKTLCVHVVHVNDDEIEILAARKAKVCLCPGSNRFLGVGKAPVTEFLSCGIFPSLGTDSKASNAVLSMWREMRLLREDHPELSPATVFSMATLGGAEAWCIASVMGTLAPGKQAGILTVEYPDYVSTGEDLLEYMTTVGESVPVGWA